MPSEGTARFARGHVPQADRAIFIAARYDLGTRCKGEDPGALFRTVVTGLQLPGCYVPQGQVPGCRPVDPALKITKKDLKDCLRTYRKIN